MKTLSTAFRQFEEIIDRTDVLGKQTKRELICLYHNYELLDMMSYVHKSRFDYSASVVSEDWKSVERYAEDIMSRRRKAYLVFQMNIDDNQNDGPAKPSLFYEKEEMIAKASTILQSIEQKLSETAVRAIQETDALPTVRAYTAIRHTLLTIIGREEVEDRNKFLNSLSLSTIYRERSAAPENQVAITGTMREQSGDSSPDASGASKLRRFI